ncbi:MAG: NUDIX domain-containing protein [Caulobacteraceae bacterium]|nr:NUDIX domain-containing protein [Caulobacteraceae bacterium]
MKPVLQFGEKRPGVAYRDRPAAFGVAVRDGRVACVRITGPGNEGWDIPGGAIDEGEDEGQALAREFREETGLIVRPLRRLGRAGQYFVRADGEGLNNLCAFHVVEVVDEQPGAKVEDDHELIWLTPEEAIRRLKHDAHAWAVTTWLRAAGTA